MSSIVVDTNPLAYIYAGVHEFGKAYALLLGDLSKNNNLITFKTANILSLSCIEFPLLHGVGRKGNI